MEWNVTPRAIREIASEHYVIYPSSQKPKFKQILDELKLPQIVARNLYLLTIPDHQKTLFLNHYEVIQEENPYLLNPFSFDDFILSYIAAELNWSVVSFDHHLLETIHQYLEFEALYPAEISLLPADSVLLLDSNIMLCFCNSEKAKKENVIDMFQKNPSMTFLIPETILIETYRVNKSLNKNTQENISIYVEDEEMYIADYIDNFEGFISNHAYRNRTKQFQRKSKRKSKTKSLKGKWGKYC